MENFLAEDYSPSRPAYQAQRDKMALLLQIQPGVGPLTALAYVLTMADVSQFRCGKQVASYLGLIPR
jgi:transposase